MQNKVSISIAATAMTNIQNALKTIDENLPGLIVLSEDERDSLPKFGDKSTGFVDKAFEYGTQRSELLPPYFSLVEMEKDINTRADLLKIVTPIKAVLEKLTDTYMVAGSEAFLAALRIYDILKKADHDGVPGLRNMIDELQKRFPGRSSSLPKKAPK
jgi:hypothetical protein